MKEPKDFKNAVYWAKKYLQDKKTKNPHYNSEFILAHVLGKTRLDIIINPNNLIKKSQCHKFKTLVKARADGLPLDYILKETDFYGNKFYVDKNVLIPRNETETMVERILSLNFRNNKNLIIDIGTGSGAITVILAQYVRNANFIAIDISKKALKIAKLNARRHGVYKKIKFVHGSLLNTANKKLLTGYNHIVLAANLPYVENKYLRTSKKKKRLYEPISALNGGRDGLNLIRKFIIGLRKIRSEIDRNIQYDLFLESSEKQIKKVRSLIGKNIEGAEIEILKDYRNKSRITHASFA